MPPLTSLLPDDAPNAATSGPVEWFSTRDNGVWRHVRRTNGAVTTSLVSGAVPDAGCATAAVEGMVLREPERPAHTATGEALRIVDLFAGVGGLTLGIQQAGSALGRPLEVVLAADHDQTAMAAYQRNFPGARTRAGDVEDLLDGDVGGALTTTEAGLAADCGRVDLLVGGPPCQGHSAFNNATRHTDGRNRLYLRMVRAAEVLRPATVMIENVPGARADRGGVVDEAAEHLNRLGYAVDVGVVDLADLGVAQRRRRLVLLATRDRALTVAGVVSAHERPTRGVGWAIEDLADVRRPGLMDQPARSAPQTRQRIDYLFDHDLHDLPNEMRPACHQGDHSYVSIYGRLRADQPAQTITRGFSSMCMGRYVHPTRRRTLTAHEAARLQHLPDHLDWSAFRTRGGLALAIGNAVPPVLSRAVALEALR